MIFYLNLGPTYKYEYVEYEKDGEKKWECKNAVFDELNDKNWAMEICNENPSCKYIAVENTSKTDENGEKYQSIRYNLCNTLRSRNSPKVSALQKKGGPYENFRYEEHSVGKSTNWDCENITSVHFNFDDAVKACDQNPSCNYIENKECYGREGYRTCSTVIKTRKSCAFKKTGI